MQNQGWWPSSGIQQPMQGGFAQMGRSYRDSGQANSDLMQKPLAMNTMARPMGQMEPRQSRQEWGSLIQQPFGGGLQSFYGMSQRPKFGGGL